MYLSELKVECLSVRHSEMINRVLSVDKELNEEIIDREIKHENDFLIMLFIFKKP